MAGWKISCHPLAIDSIVEKAGGKEAYFQLLDREVDERGEFFLWLTVLCCLERIMLTISINYHMYQDNVCLGQLATKLLSVKIITS